MEEYQVETIVLGYPKNMDDSIGERALKTEEFRNMLVRRTGLPVVLWDERLTTIEANEILIESGVRREDRKNGDRQDRGHPDLTVLSGLP